MLIRDLSNQIILPLSGQSYVLCFLYVRNLKLIDLEWILIYKRVGRYELYKIRIYILINILVEQWGECCIPTSSAWNDIAVEISRRQRPENLIYYLNFSAAEYNTKSYRFIWCAAGDAFCCGIEKVPTPWNVLNDELSILLHIPPTFCRYRQATRIKHKANTSHTSVLAHQEYFFLFYVLYTTYL